MLAYRESGKAVQAPAIRKVIESVLRQKIEHIVVLRPLDALYTGVVPRIEIAAGSGPEELLQALVSHERAFAASLDAFSESIQDEEPKQTVKALADASRKFASWAQDHIDLLSMF
ncbi:MAG: hypothetical protein CVV47_05945 [Spirochaetae bacterium HGW-Spirochaetae-3]|nr:MAG: hypothetical protein CVV47_05945 [Spirochaetae bacterium HGW-Spirochaetae-3]